MDRWVSWLPGHPLLPLEPPHPEGMLNGSRGGLLHLKWKIRGVPGSPSLWGALSVEPGAQLDTQHRCHQATSSRPRPGVCPAPSVCWQGPRTGASNKQHSFFHVLEARCLKSSLWQGPARFPWGLLGAPFLPPPSIPWLVATPFQSFPHHHTAFSPVSVCLHLGKLLDLGPLYSSLTSSLLDYMCKDPISK